MVRAAETRPASYREADNSIEVVWSVGAAGLRFDWYDGGYYIEELSMEPGAVRLERLNAGACVLDSHSASRLSSVLGSIVPGTVSIANGEGTARVRLASTPDVADTVAKIVDGHIRSLSVSYHVYEFQRTEREGEHPHMLATDWEPTEVSFVAVPFDAAAQVRARSAEQGGSNPCTIRGAAAPTTENTMPDPVIAPAADTPPAPAPTPSPAPAPAPAPSPAPAPEQQRAAPVTIARIREQCARTADLGDAFALELIGLHDTTPLTEADLNSRVADRLIAARSRDSIDARAGRTGTESEGYRTAVEDALLMSANSSVNPAALGIDDARAAAAREFRGLTLLEMSRDFLQRTGIRVAGLGKHEVAGQALGMRGGALTTSDFANALGNAANRRVRQAFAAAPQSFRGWVSTGTLPDFRPASIIGMGDAPALLLVKENGEIKHGALTDTGDTYKLATYARIIPISRQAIINDDKGLFGRIPTQFANKAADLESDLVYSQLQGNPNTYDGVSLFHTSHNNLAPAGTAITVTAVGAGRAAMRQQKTAENGNMSIRPAFLIVGPLQETPAEQFLAVVNSTSNGNVNPFSGKLTLVVDERIIDYSWYLAADPNAYDTILLAHLEGQEEVFTDTHLSFEVDGIKFKARLDATAKALDWRGLYKNPGAAPA
ncbi:prohead protease/major capsid protein fusion protein [Sphingomonas sp.]|uniref:prohead protease/major capsid protein fusion protein n=1 Tax=Sphingomonas sp. TaxID=28214 RepID=UPI003AFFA62F